VNARRCAAAILALAAALAACQPKKVNVVDRAAGGYAAVAAAEAGEAGEAGEGCTAELRQRATEEARYFCKAHGRTATFGGRKQEQTADGCVFEVEFWCSAR
jgi:hypothetical protein